LSVGLLFTQAFLIFEKRAHEINLSKEEIG
jgi:hypothetical protein